MKKDKNVTTNKVTQKVLIDRLAEETGATKRDLKEVLDLIISITCEILSETDENASTELKIANGLSIGTKYIAPHTGKSPFDQTEIQVKEHLRPYVKFGDRFKKGINN